MPNPRLEQLPSIDQWLRSPAGQALIAEFSRPEVTELMREHVAALRRGLTGDDGLLPDIGSDGYLAGMRAELLARRAPSLVATINATGIVVHTNLGRAPLARQALDAIAETAGNYANLELERDTGKRGSRYQHVESLITRLCGSEAAIVVNNCAAAVILSLRTLAADGEVLVSRGELIEIGGSFRMPDVITASGATMREVGTTNRTTLADYEREISDRTRVLLSSHPSNYRVIGFTAKPTLRELAELAHANACLCILDLGSGSLVDLGDVGLAPEPTVAQCVDSGADLVLFSGDKLLGGPQAGLIAGRSELISRIKREPMLRAMRIDKLSLAALAATLQLYLPPHDPFDEIPVLEMLSRTKADIERRAAFVVSRLRAGRKVDATLIDDASFAGGGSLPMTEIPTKAIRLRIDEGSPEAIAERLRLGSPPVIGRIKDDAIVLDLRTVAVADDDALIGALTAALAAS